MSNNTPAEVAETLLVNNPLLRDYITEEIKRDSIPSAIVAVEDAIRDLSTLRWHLRKAQDGRS